MAGDYLLQIRVTGRVTKQRHDTLEQALAALEAAVEELTPHSQRQTIDLRVRRFEPIAQVAVRAQLRGPDGVRGGVDLRGDGSAEAFTGSIRRRLVEQRRGETAFDALRRALSER